MYISSLKKSPTQPSSYTVHRMSNGDKKRKSKRMAKQDRKNLNYWAEGARERVLEVHLPDYAAADALGWRQERAYMLKVMKHYHTMIDWRLELHEDPPMPLPRYDPEAPEVKEVLSEEEEARRGKIVAEQYEVGVFTFSNLNYANTFYTIASTSVAQIPHSKSQEDFGHTTRNLFQ